MRKFFSSIYVVFLIGVMLGIGLAPLANADDIDRSDTSSSSSESDSSPTNSEIIGACSQNFLTFMSTLLDRMAFEDYWQDYFVRNRCQQEDIFVLDEEVESLLEELATEYKEKCSSDEIVNLQNEIRNKKMETYFVRHIVTVEEKNSYRADQAAIEEAAEAMDAIEKIDGTRIVEATSDGVVIETARIFEEMKAKYVDKKAWVQNEDAMIDLINGWVESYDHRIPTYWDCTISPWEEVTIKFKELGETFESIKDIGSDAKEINEEYKKEKEAREAELAAQGVKDGGDKDGPKGWQAIKGFFQKHIDLKIREIDPPKDEAELVEELGNSTTVESLLTAIVDEETRYQEEVEGATMLGEYWASYQKGTVEMTADLTFRINELSKVIQNSSTGAEFLPGLKKAAKEVHKKQGSGTP